MRISIAPLHGDYSEVLPILANHWEGAILLSCCEGKRIRKPCLVEWQSWTHSRGLEDKPERSPARTTN